MKKLIVFDLDGTLYMSEVSFISAVRAFLETYNHPMPTYEFLYRFIGEPGYIFSGWIRTLKIDKPVDELLLEFNEVEKGAVVQDGKLFPETIETLEWLQSQGFDMALCSNGPRWYIDLIFSRFGLDKYIKWIKCPQSKEETKGVMLTDLMTQLKPDEAYMVGDRHHDLEGAHESGMTFIAALYGFGSHEIGGAENIAITIADVKKFVNR